MEKIRVAHVITNIDGSGGVKNTLLTCAGLDHTRYDIDLIVGSQCDRSRIEDLDVTLIQIPAMHSPFRPFSDVLAARDLLKLFRQRRHHIVHTHFGKAGILGRWAAHRAQIPILIHGLHGATFNPSQNPLVNAVDKLAERAATRWTDVVISVGEDLQQHYLNAGVGHPEQYVIIHSGMDLSAYRKAATLDEHVRMAKRRSLGLQEDAFVAGCIANLEHRKGHRHLVRLIAQLAPRYPNLHLILAGEGPEKSRLQAMVRRAGLTDRIHFLGYREEGKANLQLSDVGELIDIEKLKENCLGKISEYTSCTSMMYSSTRLYFWSICDNIFIVGCRLRQFDGRVRSLEISTSNRFSFWRPSTIFASFPLYRFRAFNFSSIF